MAKRNDGCRELEMICCTRPEYFGERLISEREEQNKPKKPQAQSLGQAVLLVHARTYVGYVTGSSWVVTRVGPQ